MKTEAYSGFLYDAPDIDLLNVTPYFNRSWVCSFPHTPSAVDTCGPVRFRVFGVAGVAASMLRAKVGV